MKLSSFLNFFVPCLALMLAESFELLIYARFPIEQKFFHFLIITASAALGSTMLGKLSDIYVRKNVLVFTQIVGLLAWSAMYFISPIANIYFLAMANLLYSPHPVVRAALIDNFSNITDRKIIAITVIAQALPWSCYGLLQNIAIAKVTMPLGIATLACGLYVIFIFADKWDKNAHKKKQLTFVSWSSAIWVLAAFLSAETIYFITALFTETTHSWDKGSLFIVISISVSLGSILHFLIGSWHTVSYRNIISSTYGLGAILIFLLTLSNFLLNADHSFLPFLAIISCLGGFYIPLVYSHLLDLFHSTNRGFICGFAETMQSTASVLAPLTFFLLINNTIYVSILLTILYLLAFFLNSREKGGFL